MTRKHYKNEEVLKILVVLAGIVALIFQLLSLVSIGGYGYYYYAPVYYYGIAHIIFLIIGMVISVLTIFCGMRKRSKSGGEILPFHWLTFLILGILLFVFGGGWIPLVLLIIAFLIALIEDV